MSQILSIRVDAKLYAELKRRADHEETTVSKSVRKLLAAIAGRPDLGTVLKPGRPPHKNVPANGTQAAGEEQ